MTVFPELFQAHSRDVYRFALFLSGDHDLAEDIVSETFVRVWHARDRLDLTTVKAYLLAIARNLFLDERRRAARRTALEDEHVDPRPGPEQAASSRGELDAVLFTALPFTFTFSGGRITFVLFRDEPIIAAAWWATAAVLWGWHFRIRRRLAVSGI